MNTFGACRMQQHIVQFVALAVNSQMQYATPIVNVADFEQTQLFAARAVIQQHGEYGAVAPVASFTAISGRCVAVSDNIRPEILPTALARAILACVRSIS
jgi:hypothetical protein